MNNELRLSKSCIGEEEKKAVKKVLDIGFFGMGKEVKDFENELSNFFGRRATCVVNGTAALQLALQAAGIERGDEVLVQSITYVASFQSITANGAKPIACDIDPDSLTIDLEDARKRLTSKTKAIMPVHYAGGVGNLDNIYKFARDNNLRIIEDAAHAFGTLYKDNLIGSFGDISCFSFDGIKNITSGEGGCIVSDDEDVIKSIQDFRLLGVQGDTHKRFSGGRSWDPDVKNQGWRYHMSDLVAAIGRVQLANFNYHKKSRQDLAKKYFELVKSIPSVSAFNHNYDEVVPHIFVVKIAENIDRKKLIELLKKEGIPAGIHYKPNHTLSFFNQTHISLKKTEEIFPKILTLPLHPDLTKEDITYICSKLEEALKNAKESSN